MENLTREQAISKHRKMWNWIAEQIKESERVQDIDELKTKYCRKNNVNIFLDCFLCEFQAQNKKIKRYCDKSCILLWENNGCMDSEYVYCDAANTWEKQYSLALKIANLKERKFEDEN